jgi:20S proteasome alpha/beta subunit
MKAATSSGNTAIAVRGSKSAVFVTQKKVPVSNCIVFSF